MNDFRFFNTGSDQSFNDLNHFIEKLCSTLAQQPLAQLAGCRQIDTEDHLHRAGEHGPGNARRCSAAAHGLGKTWDVHLTSVYTE